MQPSKGAAADLVATRFGVPLEVLHVEEGGSIGPFQSRATRVAELMATHDLGQRLEQLVAGLGDPVGDPGATTTRLASRSPVVNIFERSAVSDHDLIVLGARQRSDLGWQFRDDIARQVSSLAQSPTLTVHDRGERSTMGKAAPSVRPRVRRDVH